MIVQHIPSKPSFLSSDEWQFLLERDCHQCACITQCRHNGGIVPCSADLDIDHIHPRVLGGDDSVANVRLLCRNGSASANRNRLELPDPKWVEPNYWDSEIAVGPLREIQKIAGCDTINGLREMIAQFERTKRPDGSPNTFHQQLLGNLITLLVGATGTGKTLLMQSVLFTINNIIGPGRPRIKHGLWLSPDTTIRDMAKKELEKEGTDLGLVMREPLVNIAKGFSDLMRGPMGAALTVTCPQALWEKDTNDQNGRSVSEKIAALIQYDFIVFDEVDWASEQVRHIADHSKHAVKFSLTASPPMHGAQNAQLIEFLKRFVLISPDAIADYGRAHELDGCLKILADPVVAAYHPGHDYLISGKQKEAQSLMPPDQPLYLPAILQAAVEADQEETLLKERVGDNYYSPHIQVAMPSIHDIRLMKPDLEQALDHFKKIGRLRNEGWGVCAVYGGHQREKNIPIEEKDLSATTTTGGLRHPFMVAKDNNGRATKSSKRILLMCQIGDRALNNWPINKFVDNTTDTSFAMLIQRDYGRPIRWQSNRSAWLDNKADEVLRKAATATIYVPRTLATDEKMLALSEARDFIENMRSVISDAGFLTWSDLLSGRSIDDEMLGFDPTTPPLTKIAKFKIQGELSKATGVASEIDLSDVKTTVERLFPAYKPKQIKKAVIYGSRLITRPAFRRSEMVAPELFARDPVSVMEKLHPQETYEVEDLTRFVKGNPSYKNNRTEIVECLEAAHNVTIVLVSERLRELQQLMYRAPTRTRRLHGTMSDPGVLREIANEISQELYAVKQAPTDKSAVPRAVNRAACQLFGLPHADEGGTMDHAAYHIAILGRYRRDIERMVRGLLINEGKLGPDLQQFAEANEYPQSEDKVA